MTDSTLTINNILAPELTLCRVNGTSKKRILEFISEKWLASTRNSTKPRSSTT